MIDETAIKEGVAAFGAAIAAAYDRGVSEP